jgi:hypothetical protein
MKHLRGQAGIVLTCTIALSLMFIACEKIDPTVSGGLQPSLSDGEEYFTCISCHRNETILDSLAIEIEAVGGGGG